MAVKKNEKSVKETKEKKKDKKEPQPAHEIGGILVNKEAKRMVSGGSHHGTDLEDHN